MLKTFSLFSLISLSRNIYDWEVWKNVCKANFSWQLAIRFLGQWIWLCPFGAKLSSSLDCTYYFKWVAIFQGNLWKSGKKKAKEGFVAHQNKATLKKILSFPKFHRNFMVCFQNARIFSLWESSREYWNECYFFWRRRLLESEKIQDFQHFLCSGIRRQAYPFWLMIKRMCVLLAIWKVCCCLLGKIVQSSCAPLRIPFVCAFSSSVFSKLFLPELYVCFF